MILSVDEIQGDSGVTRYHYPADLDRLERMTYPDGEIVRYGYDASGQPAWLSQVDSRGNWLAYYIREIVYDLRGRPLAIERGNFTSDRFEYHGASENFALARISSQRPRDENPRSASRLQRPRLSRLRLERKAAARRRSA